MISRNVQRQNSVGDRPSVVKPSCISRAQGKASGRSIEGGFQQLGDNAHIGRGTTFNRK